MIDFHSHFLPGIDDGSSSAEESVAMLAESYAQGVDIMFATPHFYPQEEDPEAFIERRAASCAELVEHYRALPKKPKIPQLHLGAEVYYFPGISECEEIKPLSLYSTGMLLIEPPVAPFSDAMLSDIANVYPSLGLVPVIAHLDRYCRMLRDDSLFDVVASYGIDIQVNASFLIRKDMQPFALKLLREERFAVLGSDCHNMTSRAPNMRQAAMAAKEAGFARAFGTLMAHSYDFAGMEP